MIGPKVPKPTPAEARAARKHVRARSGDICEGCGIRRATDMHHRLYKSRGGTDTIDNLIHLCGGESGLPGGNHSGCHGLAHTITGERVGWSVKSGNDPAEIPVWHRRTQGWTIADRPVLAATALEILFNFGQMVAA
jgi:hypothetical protein